MRAAALRRVAAALARLEAMVKDPAPPVGSGPEWDVVGEAVPSARATGALIGAGARAAAGSPAGSPPGVAGSSPPGATGTLEADAPNPSASPSLPDLDTMLRQVEVAVLRATDRLADAQGTSRRLLAALAHVTEGVVVADPGGTIVYRNPQAATFVGARHGEVLAERAVGEMLRAALAGESREATIELFSPPRRTLAIRARPLTDSGLATGAVAVIEDISEKRRLEAVRRDFVANISHELKTPVGALSLVAETLEDEDDPVVVARLTERVRAEAERLGRIIEDLLDLSRIEAEETPSRESVPVPMLLSEAVDRLRPVADHRGIRLEVDGPTDLVIRGDRRQLVSAVHNLVDNAIKYSEDGSAVQVTATVTPDQSGSGAWIELAVADHGIGIPSRDLERVFERFYRVDRARSRDTGGTGLGLAIVRHVATNHGGEVRVESREGEGSTFLLRLPGDAPGGRRGPGGGPASATAEVRDDGSDLRERRHG